MRPATQAWAAVRAERRGICGLVSESRARSISEGLSRRSTLTIRDRRPVSAQDRPSKRSAGTAATALQAGPVAPVRDLLALTMLPYRADPMMSRRFQIGAATLSAHDP